MVWSAETLKIPARQWPDLSTYAADQIENAVDVYVASLPGHHAVDSTKLSFIKVVEAVEEQLSQDAQLEQLDVGVPVSVDAKDPGCDVCALLLDFRL